MGSAILAERQFPYMEQGGHVCKSLSHGEQPCLRGKKSQGSPNGSCLSVYMFQIGKCFFRGEPLGYPWEGGWDYLLQLLSSLLGPDTAAPHSLYNTRSLRCHTLSSIQYEDSIAPLSRYVHLMYPRHSCTTTSYGPIPEWFSPVSSLDS